MIGNDLASEIIEMLHTHLAEYQESLARIETQPRYSEQQRRGYERKVYGLNVKIEAIQRVLNEIGKE